MAQPVTVQSAIRIPSPQPHFKRKRSPDISPPRRYRSPPRGISRTHPTVPELDPQRARERERQLAERLRAQNAKKAEEDAKPKAPPDPKAEFEKLMSLRSGGTYIPPAKLRALQAMITDKKSKEYQRLAWDALKKSINGLINKINVSNIKHIVPELFGENLIRGRGLYCRSIMKAQAASLPFTPIYAAMTAIVNTKLPQVGELLLNRLVVQFRKAFRRNDKAVCLSSTTFIAHLCNQSVAHEILVIEILMLLLNKPTDDSVEIAVGLMREVGAHLEEMAARANNAVFERFRTILHEANIDKRTQYMIEVLFQVRRDKYKDNPPIKPELDLVEEEDQITHRTELDEEIDTMDGLNIFKFDPDWEEHEELYKKTKAEILGEASGSDEEDGEDDSDDSSDEDDEEKEKEKQMEIQDQSNTNLVNLRKTIYLTIMSSIDFEECCHKLMKITLPVGLEHELCSMIIECCSQERTYSKFYGLIGERFAKLNRLWTDLFEQSFKTYYETIHRYETNRLRNIARFFGHMFSTDAIGWHVFSVIHINEEETTSSSRIFVKIFFQDLAEAMGMKKLVERLKDPYMQEFFAGLFPRDNPRNTRFSINYFTSIGMGMLTEEMREWLQTMPKPAPPPAIGSLVESDSESISSKSSYSSYSSRSSRSKSYSRSRSPARENRVRERSYTRSISTDSRRSRNRSRSYDSYSSGSRPRSKSSPRPYSRDRRSGSRSRSRSHSISSERDRDGTGTRDRRQNERRGRERERSYSQSSVSRSPSGSRTASSSLSESPVRGDVKFENRRQRRERHDNSSRSISHSRSRTRSKTSTRRRTREKPPRKHARSPSSYYSRSPSRSRSLSPSASPSSHQHGTSKSRRRSPSRSPARPPVRSHSPVIHPSRASRLNKDKRANANWGKRASPDYGERDRDGDRRMEDAPPAPIRKGLSVKVDERKVEGRGGSRKKASDFL